jgi:Patched family
LLLEISGASVLVGFCVSLIFLLVELSHEGNHTMGKVIGGSLVGSLLITCCMILSLVIVVGLSILAGVNLTGFSVMSFVLSVGFVVEYAVHVVSRWLHAPNSLASAAERVHYSMSFLLLPTFMSFISSTIGTVCLAFTQFSFTEVFYFRPLIIVMFVTYFVGCWWLPAFLTLLDFDFLKLGHDDHLLTTADDDKQNDSEPEGTLTQTVGLGQAFKQDDLSISDHSC